MGIDKSTSSKNHLTNNQKQGEYWGTKSHAKNFIDQKSTDKTLQEVKIVQKLFKNYEKYSLTLFRPLNWAQH